ncbi:hypothetical protein CPB85DRAFT_1278177 [Mucidula mucida]|nr:hypothetical protein CPB85DRAFT_1278177 [Mucidula mucida]
MVIGAYVVLFAICLKMTLDHPLKSKAAKFLLGAILLLFVSTTSQFVFDMIFILQQIKAYIMATDVPLAERRSRYIARFLSLRIAAVWPVMVNFMISDIIVVWRAWVLYPNRMAIRAILAVVTLADAFLWFYSQGLVSTHANEPNSPTTDQQISTASTFMSLGANVVGTVCIAAKAFAHQRSVKAAWRNEGSARRGDVSRILFVLVETGAIFAVVQLLDGITGQVDLVALTPLDLATDVIGKAAIYLAAILPTATVIIVRSHQSVETWSLQDSSGEYGKPKSSTRISTMRFGNSVSTARSAGDMPTIDYNPEQEESGKAPISNYGTTLGGSKEVSMV